MNIQTSKEIAFLRLPQVMQRTGLCRSTIYLQISKGNFPKPIRLGGRACGWISTDVEAWIHRQIAASRPTGMDAHSEIFRKMENQTVNQTGQRSRLLDSKTAPKQEKEENDQEVLQ